MEKSLDSRLELKSTRAALPRRNTRDQVENPETWVRT